MAGGAQSACAERPRCDQEEEEKEDGADSNLHCKSESSLRYFPRSTLREYHCVIGPVSSEPLPSLAAFPASRSPASRLSPLAVLGAPPVELSRSSILEAFAPFVPTTETRL